MKALILNQMSELLKTDDVLKRAIIRDSLVSNINLVKLNIDEKGAIHFKKLIIDTIHKYVNTTNPALKSALQDHYKTLEALIINYC